MTVKLLSLTDHHLKFISLKEAAQACLSLHLSKCHIVGILSHVVALMVILTETFLSAPYTNRHCYVFSG